MIPSVYCACTALSICVHALPVIGSPRLHHDCLISRHMWPGMCQLMTPPHPAWLLEPGYPSAGYPSAVPHQSPQHPGTGWRRVPLRRTPINLRSTPPGSCNQGTPPPYPINLRSTLGLAGDGVCHTEAYMDDRLSVNEISVCCGPALVLCG